MLPTIRQPTRLNGRAVRYGCAPQIYCPHTMYIIADKRVAKARKASFRDWGVHVSWASAEDRRLVMMEGGKNRKEAADMREGSVKSELIDRLALPQAK